MRQTTTTPVEAMPPAALERKAVGAVEWAKHLRDSADSRQQRRDQGRNTSKLIEPM